MSNQPIAVVFDMDGTLFDSETLCLDAFLTTARQLNCSLGLEDFLAVVGLPDAANRTMLASRLGTSEAAGTFERMWMRRFHGSKHTLRMKPGVTEMLDWLNEMGVPRAICTSSNHAAVDQNLSRHGLVGRFTAIVAEGDYLRPKPAPDAFLQAAYALGVAPADCLAVEDSFAGVRAASAAGMRTVMVPDLLMPSDEIRGLCWFVASDLNELRSHCTMLRTRTA